MIEFLNRIFGRQSSGATAKERLRLVLMSDHLSLAPDIVEAMKRDLVDVISRYVEVDREKIDVHFEHQDKALAMLANIPITGVNRNGSNGHTNDNGARPNPVSSSHPEESKDDDSRNRTDASKGSTGSPEGSKDAEVSKGQAQQTKPRTLAANAKKSPGAEGANSPAPAT